MEKIEEFSFKKLFLPFTNLKAVYLIIFLGLLTFGNMLLNKFVWDDKAFIVFNPDVQNFNIINLFKASILNNISAGRYLPATGFYFSAIYLVFADSIFIYHLIQLLIHIANSILIFYLFKNFLKKEIAFFLSIVFLIHPIQVESVSYIASPNNPLFFLFGISALILSMKSDISWKRLTTLFTLLFFSLLAKETGILFVFIVILYRFIFAKKNKTHFLIPGFFISLIYISLRFFVGGIYFSKINLSPITRLDFLERLAQIPSVIFYYLKTFVFPLSLTIDQQWLIKINLTDFYLPLIIDSFFFISLFVFGHLLFKKNKKFFLPFVFFTVWFILGIGMHSQIIPLEMTVADRWFYFSFVGLIGILGIVVQYYYELIEQNKKIFLIIAIFLISILSLRTIIRNSNWKDPIILYSHDIKIEDNFDLENNLGAELKLVGNNSDAFSHFKKSVALFPHETNLFNLGLSYQQKGDFKKAETYYFMALNSKSYGEVVYPHRHNEILYHLLAGILLQHNVKKALEIVNLGLNDYPNSAQLWYDKAIFLIKLNNKKEALVAAKKAYFFLPNSADTNKLYNALLNNKSIIIK